jgi:hypothetical protein
MSSDGAFRISSKLRPFSMAGKPRAGYLIVVATSTKFAKRPGFGEVLEDRSAIVTQDLFLTYKADWLDLLRGGPGRPVQLPAHIDTRLLVSEPLENVPGWEIRAIKVVVPEDAGYVKFVNESWPAGHPRLP